MALFAGAAPSALELQELGAHGRGEHGRLGVIGEVEPDRALVALEGMKKLAGGVVREVLVNFLLPNCLLRLRKRRITLNEVIDIYV